MEEFKKRGINIQIITTDTLSEEYSKMIKQHQAYLYENLAKVIQQHIRGISKTQIESLIDRYFLTDLKYRGKQTISKLNDGFQTAFIETISAEKEQDKEQLLKTYSEKIKVPIRKSQTDGLKEIAEQFSTQLRKKIDLHFAPFANITPENINKTMDAIDRDVSQIMKQYQKKFNQEYQAILNDFLNANLKQISSLIEKKDLIDKKASDFQMYSAIAELSNHQLIEENDHLYAISKSTEEKVELTHQGDLLMSSDRKIRYRVDCQNKRLGYYDGQTRVAILVHNGLITVIPPTSHEQGKNTISFAKKEHTYQLYHNLKPVTDIAKIRLLIEQIAQYAEGIYHKLVTDPDFKELLPEIAETQNKDTSASMDNEENLNQDKKINKK